MWHWIGSGNTFPVFVPHWGFLVFRIRQCHWLSANSVVKSLMRAPGARPKEAKINLMDWSCLCSEVEIFIFHHSSSNVTLEVTSCICNYTLLCILLQYRWLSHANCTSLITIFVINIPLRMRSLHQFCAEKCHTEWITTSFRPYLGYCCELFKTFLVKNPLSKLWNIIEEIQRCLPVFDPDFVYSLSRLPRTRGYKKY